MIVWTHAGGPTPADATTLCRWLGYRDDPTHVVLANSAELATDNMQRMYPGEDPPYTVDGAQRIHLERVP